MHCKICQLLYIDPRFTKDRQGSPLYYRDPSLHGQPRGTAITDLYCGPHHAYLDHLRTNGQDVPDWLSAAQPEVAHHE